MEQHRDRPRFVDRSSSMNTDVGLSFPCSLLPSSRRRKERVFLFSALGSRSWFFFSTVDRVESGVVNFFAKGSRGLSNRAPE